MVSTGESLLHLRRIDEDLFSPLQYFIKPIVSHIINVVNIEELKSRGKQCVFIEDIDLLGEIIVVRNPSRYPNDISGFKVSDDNGVNFFHLPTDTVIPPKGRLALPFYHFPLLSD